MTSPNQKEAITKSDVTEFIDLDNQILVEAFGYSQIPLICIACQNLFKPQGKHFKCLAGQDGGSVATTFEASEPGAPLSNICSGFRSCLPTKVVYDPSGHRRSDPPHMIVNCHKPPQVIS